MKKIHWKLLNAALWIEIILSYFLPFKVTHDFQYQAGIPMAFISVYDTKPGISPFMSMHFNPIGFVLDVAVIYLIIWGLINLYQKKRTP